MPTMNEERAAAGARYAAAVIELRRSFVELAAWDRLFRKPGFGNCVDIIALRHSEFAPDVSGSMTDGIADAIARLSREESR